MFFLLIAGIDSKVVDVVCFSWKLTFEELYFSATEIDSMNMFLLAIYWNHEQMWSTDSPTAGNEMVKQSEDWRGLHGIPN